MRRKDLNAAQKYLHRLLTAEPQNPYFWELKAQTFFESGRPRDAVKAYRRALDLKPSSDQFKLAYAEAVLSASPSRPELQSLIPLLEQANRSRAWPSAWHYLGQVYAGLGQIAVADYFAAEYNAAVGENAVASRQLAKALKQPLHANIKLRAEDLKARLAQENKKNSLF